MNNEPAVATDGETRQLKGSRNPVIRVMLVDNHPIALLGLAVELGRYADIHVESQARDGETAIRIAADSQPDVALLDPKLPGIDGFQTTDRVRRVSPLTRVILLSSRFDTCSIERALELHVSGLLLKYEGPERLAEAVRRATEGQASFSKEISRLLEESPEGTYQLSRHSTDPLVRLSFRERGMIRALAGGLPLKQAALTLGLSYKSADHVKQGLMEKLGLHDRIQLVRFAIREGLADVTEAAPVTEPCGTGRAPRPVATERSAS